jgi:hypothetical protein
MARAKRIVTESVATYGIEEAAALSGQTGCSTPILHVSFSDTHSPSKVDALSARFLSETSQDYIKPAHHLHPLPILS